MISMVGADNTPNSFEKLRQMTLKVTLLTLPIVSLYWRSDIPHPLLSHRTREDILQARFYQSCSCRRKEASIHKGERK
jgi:hypothetical protein